MLIDRVLCSRREKAKGASRGCRDVVLLECVSASSSNVTRHRASAHIRLVSLEHGESRGETRTWNLLAPGGRSTDRATGPSIGRCVFPSNRVRCWPTRRSPPTPRQLCRRLASPGSGLRNALGTAAPAAHEMSLALCVGIPEHATSPGVSLSPAATHPVSLNPTASPPTPCSVRVSTPAETPGHRDTALPL